MLLPPPTPPPILRHPLDDDACHVQQHHERGKNDAGHHTHPIVSVTFSAQAQLHCQPVHSLTLDSSPRLDLDLASAADHMQPNRGGQKHEKPQQKQNQQKQTLMQQQNPQQPKRPAVPAASKPNQSAKGAAANAPSAAAKAKKENAFRIVVTALIFLCFCRFRPPTHPPLPHPPPPAGRFAFFVRVSAQRPLACTAHVSQATAALVVSQTFCMSPRCRKQLQQWQQQGGSAGALKEKSRRAGAAHGCAQVTTRIPPWCCVCQCTSPRVVPHELRNCLFSLVSGINSCSRLLRAGGASAFILAKGGRRAAPPRLYDTLPL
jgi:hypothetical protein